MPGPQNAPRSAIIAMLRDGHSNKRIATELRVDKTRVARLRRELGLPTFVRTEETRSIEDKWRLHARMAEGGHVEWTGERSPNGRPLIAYKDRRYSASTVAFRIRTGRDPEGYVKPECGMRHCIAPAHVDDAAGRRRTREQLRYLQGGQALPERCKSGHDQSIHGRLNTDGRSYCETCKRTRDQRQEKAA
jgi:hypothetical protein